jgi:pyruvate kinase
MNLMWGVIPVLVNEQELNDPISLSRRLVSERNLAASGDYVLLVRGFSGDPEKNTPSITLLTV